MKLFKKDKLKESLPSSQEKNYLGAVFLLCIVIIALFTFLYWIPPFQWGDFSFKRTDLYSSLRNSDPKPEIELETNQSVTDSVLQNKMLARHFAIADSTKEGLTSFIDFSSEKKALFSFFGKLDSVHSLKRPLRIAFLGDSFLEGDILVADFREYMQNKYSGAGVGFIHTVNETAGFRKSVLHSFGGWKKFSVVEKQTGDISLHTFTGAYGVAAENAWLHYQGTSYKKRLDTVNTVTVLYRSPQGGVIRFAVNEETSFRSDTLNPSTSIQKWTLSQRGIHKINIRFSNSSIICYGTWMENGSGISVDNYAMRSHTGLPLEGISPENIKRTDQLIHYDLIIFEYGLNASWASATSYPSYEKGMIKMIDHLKRNLPNTSFLLWSVGDRCNMKNGQPETTTGTLAMIKSQKRIAQESGIAFWNLFEAMGGKGSMGRFVSANPPKANKDFTHINFIGGRYLSSLFIGSLEFEQTKYKMIKALYQDTCSTVQP